MEEQTLIIQKNATWAQLQRIKQEDLDILYKAFRFRKPNYNPKYNRNRFWDGYTNFISKKTGSFLAGLIPEMELALEKLHISYERKKTKDCQDPIIIPEKNIPKSVNGKNLRDYQYEYVKRMCSYSRGIIKAATGAGKTLIMISYIKSLPSKTPVLIVFRSKDLLSQTYQEIIDSQVIDPNKVGRIFSGRFEPNIVTLSTVQSLHLIEDLLPHIKVLIVDEAHEGITTNATVPFLRKMKQCTNRYAFSATPWKKDQVHNYKLKGYFGPQLGEVPTQELQKRGILSQAECYFYSVGNKEDSGNDYYMEYQPAYKKYITENQEFHDIVLGILKKCKGRTLIVVEQIDHGDYLFERIPKAVWINGATKNDDRKIAREKLRSHQGDIVVIATRIFGTGIDMYIHNLINCAGMASDIATIQRFGRGLRKSNDKEKVKYYDFIHFTNKYLERHSKERIKTLKKEGHIINLR